MTAMLVMQDIQKAYRNGGLSTEALSGFSLRIFRSEFVAIMGPSGSGKTTFLNVAGLLDDFDRGTYRLDDQDVGALTDVQRSALRNQKLGFIFQSFNLVPDLDVSDNVELPLRYRKLTAGGRRGRGGRGIDPGGLGGRVRAPPAGLGGGQEQRGGHARAARRAERRTAAAGGHRARIGRRAAGPAGRRTHRQPRFADGAAHSRDPRGGQPDGSHRADGDPRAGARCARASQGAHPRRSGHRPARAAQPGRAGWSVEEGRVRSSLLRLAPVRALRRAPALNAMILATLAFGLSVWLAANAMASSFEVDPMRNAAHLFRVELVRYPELREILRGTDMQSGAEMPSLVLSPGEVEELSRSSIPVRTAAATTAEVPFEEPGTGVVRMGFARFAGRDAFEMFAVRLAAGRVFEEGANEVLVSEGDARRWFGGSAAAVGRTLRVCGEDRRISGVVATGAAAGRRMHLA